MKLRIIDRLLCALIGVLLLAGAAAVSAELFWNVPVRSTLESWLNSAGKWRQWILIACIALAALLGLYSICTLFRRPRRSRNYISQDTDEGELSISYAAVTSLVERCLNCQSELTIHKIHISNSRRGLTIALRGTVGTGVNMPLVVSSVQREVRQYVTSCTGIDVQEVLVRVDATDGSKAESAYVIADPQPLPGTSESAAEKQRQTLARLAESAEEPVVIPPAAKPEPVQEKPADTDDSVRPALDITQVLDQIDAEDAEKAAERAEQTAEAGEDEETEAHHQRIFGHMEEPMIGPDPAPGQAEEASQEAEEPETAGDEEEKSSETVPEEPVQEQALTGEPVPAEESEEFTAAEGTVEDVTEPGEPEAAETERKLDGEITAE